MRPVDPQSAAHRRELAAGAVGFAVGFGVAAGVLGWVLVRYVVPGEGWWAVGTAVQFLVFAFLAALAVAAGAVVLMSRWHYATGVYRCWNCRRPLRGIAVVCPCMRRQAVAPAAPRRHRSRWRHHRRCVRPVLLTYAALVPVAVALVMLSPARHESPASSAAAFHALLCVLLAKGFALADIVLEQVGRGRRWRLRASVFAQTLAVWPLAALLLVIPFLA